YKNLKTGAAYVFVRSGTTRARQAELTAPHGASNDYFGYSAATTRSSAMMGASADNANAGATYVLLRASKTCVHRSQLTASDAASNDYFGVSVAISGPARLAADLYKNLKTGAAYVFVLS